MDSHGDVHGQLIVAALVVAVCGVAAALAFVFWIERRSKRKPPRGIRQGHVSRSPTKKRKK